MRKSALKPLAAAILISIAPLSISNAYAVDTIVKGDKGESGSKGDKGDAGVGLTGPAGPIDPQGIQGLTGPAGTNGLPGTPGSNGTNGSDGLPGAHAVNGTVVGQTLIWNGTVWIPTASSCTPYHWGDTGPDGGKVFYVDGSGCHGLEAQPYDVGALQQTQGYLKLGQTQYQPQQLITQRLLRELRV